MTLIQKQWKFPELVAKLIQEAYNRGYTLSFGETWRTPEQAELNHKKGIGSKNSLHISRLAVDFNVFKSGRWLVKTEELKELGEYWESLSTPEYRCCWGGRFQDGNHFSIEHEGRK